MDHYTVTISGYNYQIPMKAKDVTFAKFVKMRNTLLSDPLELVCWAIGERPEFKDCERTEKEIAGALALIDVVVEDVYIFMESKQKSEVPESVTILGTTVKLKKGILNDLPYWPFKVAQAIIKKERERAASIDTQFDPTEKISEIIAHYLYTPVTARPYVEADAAVFTEIIDAMPMTTCIQLGNFFLKKLGVLK